MKHIDELRVFMQEQKFDILSINQTRLGNTIHNNEIEIKGYDLIRKDRNPNGGGVAIYVSSITPYTTCNDLLTNDVEAICLEIKKPKRKRLLISTRYRPSSANIKIFYFFSMSYNVKQITRTKKLS